MYVAWLSVEDSNFKPKRAKVSIQSVLNFSDEDKDLIAYDSSLVSFDGKVIILRGQSRLLVQVGIKVVEVDFIVMDAYSPYTAIVAKLWLHALGVVSSTLHQKVPPQEKDELIEFLRGSADVFAWNAYKAPGVDPSFICYHLNVNPSVTPEKKLPRHSSKEHFDAAKNERMGRKVVEMFSDSRLVVSQVKGDLEARNKRMQGYLSQVRHLQSGFESFNLLHILRSRNTHVDSLTTIVTSSAQSLPRVILVEDLCKPTKVRREMVYVHQVRVGPSWMDLMVLFLKEDILPEEKLEVDKILRKGSSILAI
nr:hypothetical protein CFP56_02007 [Quercus suber]